MIKNVILKSIQFSFRNNLIYNIIIFGKDLGIIVISALQFFLTRKNTLAHIVVICISFDIRFKLNLPHARSCSPFINFTVRLKIPNGHWNAYFRISEKMVGARQSEVFGRIFHGWSDGTWWIFELGLDFATRSFSDPINTDELPSARTEMRMGLPYLNGIFPSLSQDIPWMRVTRAVAVEQRRVGLSVNVRYLAVGAWGRKKKSIKRFVGGITDVSRMNGKLVTLRPSTRTDRKNISHQSWFNFTLEAARVSLFVKES